MNYVQNSMNLQVNGCNPTKTNNLKAAICSFFYVQNKLNAIFRKGFCKFDIAIKNQPYDLF